MSIHHILLLKFHKLCNFKKYFKNRPLKKAFFWPIRYKGLFYPFLYKAKIVP